MNVLTMATLFYILTNSPQGFQLLYPRQHLGITSARLRGSSYLDNLLIAKSTFLIFQFLLPHKKTRQAGKQTPSFYCSALVLFKWLN